MAATTSQDTSIQDTTPREDTSSMPVDMEKQADTEKEADTEMHSDRDISSSKEVVADAPPKSAKPFDSVFREILFVGVICTSQFITQASLGQTMNLVHVIGNHFGTQDNGTLSWFIAGFSLTVGSFILVFGRMGDYFGYKTMFITGMLWFSLWSLVAGLANYSNSILFIFARVFEGIGPAMCLPNGVAILGFTYPPGMKKNLIFATFGAVAPGGAIIGAVFGGIFQYNWPWTFYSTCLVLLVAAAVASIVIPNRAVSTVDTKPLGFVQLLQALDILGAAVGIAALTLFNFAWNQAPSSSWADPAVITTLILGICLVPVFFFIEARVSPSPLLPLEAVNVNIGFVLACISCGWATFGIWVFYSWQFFQEIRGSGPLLTSVYYVPAIISGACAAILTGALLKFLHPAWVMVCSLTSFLIAPTLVATAGPEQTYWANTFLSMLFITWGMDMSFPAGTIIMSNAVKPEHQGVAASLIMTVVNYSISIGLGFAGNVQVHVGNGDLLASYRGALYMGIGLSALGWCLAVLFAFLRVVFAK